MKLIVGLGNPGKQYKNTRHNVGFNVLDELAERCGAAFRRNWLVPVRVGRANLEGQNVLLVQSQTFMNNSGQAVGPLMRRKGVKPEDLVVVLDDVELELGQLRIRKRGGAGGHKGLASVIQALGTEDFVRVRVGIGPRPPGDELVEHVLAPFTAEERAAIGAAVKRAADAVVGVVRDGPDKAMNDFN